MHQLARILRKNMTDAERVLWQSLRKRQLGGFKFRRQKPIGHYIVDFVCLEKKIIIEVDGGQHTLNKSDDTLRVIYLKKKGYQILRFWNHDVLRNTDSVLERILKDMKEKAPSP
jgi:very-short-patch-repair endonuclease